MIGKLKFFLVKARERAKSGLIFNLKISCSIFIDIFALELFLAVNFTHLADVRSAFLAIQKSPTHVYVYYY